MIFWSRRRHLALWILALIGTSSLDAVAQTVDPRTPCGQGRIDRIVFRNGDVFSPAPDDPELLRWVYSAANRFHIRTRPGFLRKPLLFDEGDCFDPYLLRESESILNAYDFIRRVEITHQRDASGGEVVYVETWDDWTTQASVDLTYDEGINLERIGLTEMNLLGHGIRLALRRRDYREDRSHAVSVEWPHLIRHVDILARYRSSSSGLSHRFRVSRLFVGEDGRHSLRVEVGREADPFAFASQGNEGYSHLLVPNVNEVASFQYGHRFGNLRRAWVVGVAVRRQLHRFDGAPEYVTDGDFGEAIPSPGPLPISIQEQLRSRGATYLGLHLGTRAHVPVRMVGLDGVRDVQYVSDGYLLAFTAGRSLGLFVSDSLEARDSFVHLDAAVAKPIGPSYLRVGTYMEANHTGSGWRDRMAGAEIVAYLRAGSHTRHTWFLRASAAGGWDTTMPFQLTLGGRKGVRSLREDEWPGGRRMVLLAEDRIRLDWPDWEAVDLGLTVFGDLGRMWAGDAPMGAGSGWQGSLGIGLRVGTPRGTRFIWRPDLVFPVGRRGPPVFRVMVELNQLRRGFSTEKLLRSMRFNRGIETF